MYSYDENSYSFEDVDYELLKDEALASEVKMGKGSVVFSVFIVVIGVLFDILPLLFEMKESSTIVFILCGAVLTLGGLYFAFACAGMGFKYDESGFTRRPGVGKTRSYSYEDVKAAYFYTMTKQPENKVISKGLHVIMNDRRSFNIDTKLSGGERMIAQMLTKLDKSIVYNDQYCYKHGIKEL